MQGETQVSLDVSNLSETFESTQFYLNLVQESFMAQYALQFPHPSHAQAELGFHKVLFLLRISGIVLKT